MPSVTSFVIDGIPCEQQFYLSMSLHLFSQWNSHGYDVAKMFAHKFTYISPVWLQIKRRPTGGYAVHGAHDIDSSMFSSFLHHSNFIYVFYCEGST